MKVSCPSCASSYNVDESRIPPAGLKMRCPKCSASFRVDPAGGAQVAAAPPPPPPRPSDLTWGQPNAAESDLPAPVAGQRGRGPSAVPSRPFGGVDLPVPQAPGGVDLPVPAGGPHGFGTANLPMPRAGGGGVDLPVPRAPGSGGVDLPAPRVSGSGGVDLPVPRAYGGADLPVPRAGGGQGGIDLPIPKLNPTAVDLPVPSSGGGGVDLPVPRVPAYGQQAENLDLPVPRSGAFDLPVPKSEGFKHVDLPVTRSEASMPSTGLPVPKPTSSAVDLPMPRYRDGDGGPDLPAPIGGQWASEPQPMLSSEHIVVGAGADDIFGGDGGGGWGDAAPTETPGEPPLGDTLPMGSGGGGPAPFSGEIQMGGLDDFQSFEFADTGSRPPLAAVESSPRVERQAPLQVDRPAQRSAPEPSKSRPAAKAEKKPGRPARGAAGTKALLGSLAALVVVVGLVGVGLGFTSHGFFGTAFISRTFFASGQDDALESDVVQRVRQKLALDTYRDHRDAVGLVERAIREGREGEGINAYMVFLYELYGVRYGESKQYSVASERLASALDFDQLETPAMLLAAASRAVRQGDDARAAALLTRAMAASKNVDAMQLRGELALETRQADDALSAFEALAKAENKSPRAMFGLARAHLAKNDVPAAEKVLDDLLAANPDHVGAMLERARILVGRDQDAAALELIESVESSKAAFASPLDRSRGFELKGDILIEQDKLGDALAAYREASKLNDQSVNAHLGMGEIFQRQGEVTDALTHYKMAQHIDPANLDAILGVSLALISSVGEGNLKTAHETLEKAKVDHPEEARVHYLLGRALQELSHPDEAIASYEKAIELNKTYLDPYLSLSDILIRRDRGEKAMEVLAAARRELPNNPRISVSLGQSFLDRGAYPEAEQEFRSALKVSPEYPPALFSLGVALRKMGRLNDAQATLERLARLDSRYPGLVMEQGRVLERTGQPDRALAIYRAELERDPENVDMRLRVAAAQVLVGNCDEALVLLRDVIRASPGEAEALYYQGRCLLTRGQIAEAERVLTLAVEAEPESGTYRSYLGWACIETGNLDRASLELQRAVELDGTNPVAFWQRGVLYLRSASPQSAVRDLERALELNPDMFAVYHHLALAYDQMRRPADAIRYFELAIEHDPNDFESLYNLAQIVKDRRGAAASLNLFKRAVSVGRALEPMPRSFYDALFGYGATLHEVGRIEPATQVLREYLTNAPSSAVDREEARELMRVIGQGQMRGLDDEGD